MINIAEASEKDIPDIIQIAEKTWWPTYSPFLSTVQIGYMLETIYSHEVLRQAMLDGSQTFILLHDEMGLQGFASFGERSEDRHVYKLHKLYVLPENQGKGYGKMLIEEVKNWTRKKNVYRLDLNVNRLNPARFFYEKMGFKILCEEDIPIGIYWMNDFVMRLELDGRLVNG